jgi:hypothetical protein
MLSELDMNTFVNIFGDSAAWMLIFAGAMALIWFFYEGYRNKGFLRGKKEEFDKYDEISKILKIIILAGMILGAIEIATGIVTMMLNIAPSDAFAARVGAERYDLFTSLLLIILGISMFLKPMLDAPLSALIGLLVAIGIGIIISAVIPDGWLSFVQVIWGINPRWIIIGVAVVIGIIVGVMVKFAIGSLETIAKVISWPPVAFLMALLCFVQGFGLLFFGYSLVFIFG